MLDRTFLSRAIYVRSQLWSTCNAQMRGGIFYVETNDFSFRIVTSITCGVQYEQRQTERGNTDAGCRKWGK